MHAAPETTRREDRRIGAYIGVGFVALYLAIPSGGLANIPLLFLLKDRLGMGAEEVSRFKLLIAAPTYVSFLFGFVRDRWSPLGWGDRGYFFLFGVLAALAYGVAAGGSLAPAGLAIALMTATLAYRFLSAAFSGLSAEVGKRRAMTGRLSALIGLVFQGLGAASTLIGGWVAERLPGERAFALVAGLSLVFVALAFWRPRAVFEAEVERPSAPTASSLGRDLLRAARHRPLWPAAAMWLLWQFVPGLGTSFAFYFVDGLKGSKFEIGTFYTINALASLPTLALYGWLCRRVAIGRLLLVGILLAIPQMIPLLFLREAWQALWLAVPIGFLGGFATGAIYDLVLRSSPPGLEGTGTMLADAGFFVAVRFGDLLGAKVYATFGYAWTAWLTTGVYALMLPLLLLVPREILRGRDAAPKVE